MGIISPAGIGVKENWENISKGMNCIEKITHFDASDYYSQIAGEIKGYNPENYFDKKEIKKIDPYIQFALIAAAEAVKDAAIENLNETEKERTGVYIGSGIGGIYTIEENTRLLMEKGSRRVSPFFLPAAIANLATGNVSIKFGFKGPNLANVTACATSTHSIGDAFKIIQRGDADIMLAGGAEYPITPLGVAGFSVMRALSSRNDEPHKASRPFDKERDGFVVAEGSAIMVLEDLEHAVKRNARIYAEVVGYGYAGDAYHVTAPEPEGRGAARTMKMALDDACIKPMDISYINAHGTSTPFNDKFETQAIKNLFGEYAYAVNISSTKSMTGHMLGATGGAEAIFSVLALINSLIPPTINLENKDDDCDLNYTPNFPVKKELLYVLSNSFGFGGTNGTLVLKKYFE
jgi:3-oxoacyl-[acyl-carrier-protein] synthase II